MIQQSMFEYFVNSLWQLPLLLLAASLVVRIARPEVRVQHALWLGTLVLAVLLPLRGIDPRQPERTAAHRNSPLTYTTAIPATSDPTPTITKTSSPITAALFSIASMRVQPVHLQSRTINWLIGLYGVSIALGLARLIYGWLAARRLAADAREQPLTALESSLLRACATRIRLPEERIPVVRFLEDAAASPMVVGLGNPVLLLPEILRQGSHTSFNDEALAAVLLHELTHIRRRDYLSNLLARVLSLPIAYHPATLAIHARIRQTREMICDATAAGALTSNASYARSLLALAAGIVSSPQRIEAVGLFDNTRNSLEERIMKLTEPKIHLSLTHRSFRIVAGAAILVVGSAVAATLHIKAATPVVYAMQLPQAAPVAPIAAASPEPAQSAPQPTPAMKPAPDLHVDVQNTRPLTEQERKQVDEDVAVAHEKTDKATQDLKLHVDIKVPPFDFKYTPGPEFEKQMAEFNKQMAEFKIQMDSPDFRKQTDEMRAKLDSPEFRKQIADAAKLASQAAVDSPEFKRQMEELKQKVNSPEFRAQIEQSKKLAMEARADARIQSAEARKQLAEASAAIAEARMQVHDETVQRQLEQAQRSIDKASKTY